MSRNNWQQASASRLIAHFQARLSPRQMRLVACAYVRQMPTASRASSVAALDVAERFADGKAAAHELASARYGGRFQPGHPAWAVCWAPEDDPLPRLERALAWAAGYGVDGDLFREIAGHVMQPAAIEASWLAWNGGTVTKLAGAIYDARDFGQMPILGDALEEAGCADGRLLEHCRGAGAHVRGCWLLDRLLGLE